MWLLGSMTHSLYSYVLVLTAFISVLAMPWLRHKSLSDRYSKSIYPWIHSFIALSAWGVKCIHWLTPDESTTKQKSEPEKVGWAEYITVETMGEYLCSVICVIVASLLIVYRIFTVYHPKADILHALRRTFASYLCSAYFPLEEVRKIDLEFPHAK